MSVNIIPPHWKFGQCNTLAERPLKFRRMKAFALLAQTDNMLRHCSDVSLATFCKEFWPQEIRSDPFNWPSCVFGPDCGPSVLAMFHFLVFEKQSNTEMLYDMSHLFKTVQCTQCNTSHCVLAGMLIFCVR